MNRNFSFKQELRIGDMLNATFTFTRMSLKTMAPVALLCIIPLALAMVFTFSSIMEDVAQMMFLQSSPSIESILSILLVDVGICLFILLVYAALFNSGFVVADNYINDMEDMTVGIAIKAVMSRLLNTFGMLFLLSLAMLLLSAIVVGIGALLTGLLSLISSAFTVLGVIGILLGVLYISVVLSLAPAVNYYEQTGYFNALERSRQLIKNRFWKSTLNYILLFIIISIAIFIFYLPAQIYSLSNLFSGLQSSDPMMQVMSIMNLFSDPVYWALATIAYLGMVLFVMVPVNMTVLYFSYREDNEKSDILNRIDGVTGGIKLSPYAFNSSADGEQDNAQENDDNPPAKEYKTDDHSRFMPKDENATETDVEQGDEENKDNDLDKDDHSRFMPK